MTSKEVGHETLSSEELGSGRTAPLHKATSFRLRDSEREDVERRPRVKKKVTVFAPAIPFFDTPCRRK